MDLPIRMSLRLTSSKMVELISLLPDVDSPGTAEVTYKAEDVMAMFRMFRVMLGLAWSLK